MASVRVMHQSAVPRSPELATRSELFAATPSPRKHIMIAHNVGTPRINRSPIRSPIRKRPAGITSAQKQALIDNLKLEIAERARRLRAQYSLQAQSLRTRVEIRLNRIPVALRKLTMGELIQRHAKQQERSAQIAAKIAAGTVRTVAPQIRPGMKVVPSVSAPQMSPRRFKRTSDAFMVDKENADAPIVVAELDNPKKRVRPGQNAPSNDSHPPVLSPSSMSTRNAPRSRPASPIKISGSRAASPIKMSPVKSRQNILTNMVEKAKTTRAAMSRKATGNATTATSRSKRNAAPTPGRTPSQPARRLSGESDSSSSTAPRKIGRPDSAMSKASSTSSRGKASAASKKAALAKATATPREAPKKVLRSRVA